jgi:hypothetical protein
VAVVAFLALVTALKYVRGKRLNKCVGPEKLRRVLVVGGGRTIVPALRSLARDRALLRQRRTDTPPSDDDDRLDLKWLRTEGDANRRIVLVRTTREVTDRYRSAASEAAKLSSQCADPPRVGTPLVPLVGTSDDPFRVAAGLRRTWQRR